MTCPSPPFSQPRPSTRSRPRPFRVFLFLNAPGVPYRSRLRVASPGGARKQEKPKNRIQSKLKRCRNRSRISTVTPAGTSAAASRVRRKPTTQVEDFAWSGATEAGEPREPIRREEKRCRNGFIQKISIVTPAGTSVTSAPRAPESDKPSRRRRRELGTKGTRKTNPKGA